MGASLRCRFLAAAACLAAGAAGCVGPDGESTTLVRGLPWVRVLELQVQPVEVGPDVARRTETAGLVTALLERRMSDLEGVVPVLPGLEPRPGLAHAVAPSERWTLAGEVTGRGDAIHLGITLCEVGGACTSSRVAGSRTELSPLVARLVVRTSSTLGRRILGDPATWTQAESGDDYAVLMTGRAAALTYGLSPPVALEALGDRRRDPLARAVFLDPAMSTAWFLRARSTWAGPLAERQRDAERAAQLDPDDPVLVADAAALALAAGDAEAALRGFTRVQAVAPHDLRFVLPLAEAGLAAGAPEVTARVAHRLRSVPVADAERLSLEVRLADVTGQVPDEELEGMLARWQEADAGDPEPVRRRIERRVRSDRYGEALELVPELRRRSPGAGVAALELGLSAATSRWEQAATLAGELGQGDLQAELRALALADQPAVAADLLSAQLSGDALVARAHLLLRAGRGQEALQAAATALAEDQWDPDALEVGVLALQALGQAEQARSLAERLALVDPLAALAPPPGGGTP